MLHALCGITAHKPTYGLVSRYGVMPRAWTADHAGPMTKTVEDAAILLQVMAGYDPKDQSSVERAIPQYRAALDGSFKGVRMALVKELEAMPHHPEVKTAFKNAVSVLLELGASLQEVAIPSIAYMARAHSVISYSECSTALLKPYLERGDDFGPEAHDQLDIALLLTPADYLVAQQVRAIFQRDAARAFQQVDVIVTPTCVVPAPRLGQNEVEFENGSKQKAATVLAQSTRPFNDTGQPAISVPCGFTFNGLPIGLQIVGKPFRDALVLRVAHQYQQATDWHTRRALVE